MWLLKDEEKLLGDEDWDGVADLKAKQHREMFIEVEKDLRDHPVPSFTHIHHPLIYGIKLLILLENPYSSNMPNIY